MQSWRQAKQQVCENSSYASNRFRNIHSVTEECIETVAKTVAKDCRSEFRITPSRIDF